MVFKTCIICVFKNLKEKGHHGYRNVRTKSNNNTTKHGIYRSRKTAAGKKKILGRFNIKLEDREEKIFELKKRAIKLFKFEYQWEWGRLKQQ